MARPQVPTQYLQILMSCMLVSYLLQIPCKREENLALSHQKYLKLVILLYEIFCFKFVTLNSS